MGTARKNSTRILHRHLQHFVDVAALVADFQRFPVVAPALADVARDVHVRQEMHFHLDDAIALAGFAPSTLDVETETAWFVAPRAGFRDLGEDFADRRKQAGVRGRIGAGRAADRTLVDVDHAVDVLESFNAIAGRRVGRKRHSTCERRTEYSVSLISVDLPDPDTPVTQVIRPRGISTVTPCRLLPRGVDDAQDRSFCTGNRMRRHLRSARARQDTGL